MKIPKCCKNCKNKNSGVCNCVLPYYCKEWVEDEVKDELSFNLYTALAITLDKQGLNDNIPSVIDKLVGKNCGKYADMYNEYKHLQKEVKELKSQVKELKKVK